MKSKTGLAFSVAAIAAVIVLFTTGPMASNPTGIRRFWLRRLQRRLRLP